MTPYDRMVRRCEMEAFWTIMLAEGICGAILGLVILVRHLLKG